MPSFKYLASHIKLNCYLGEYITDVVVSLFQVLHAAILVLLPVVPVVDDDEAKVKSFTEVKQVVSLLPRPVFVVKMLLIFQIGICRNIHGLQNNQIHALSL